MPRRGEIWVVSLDPVRGSEQAGTRPALILQNDAISKFTTTVMALPLTTNLRRAALPSSVLLHQGDGGLTSDSVVLCHQVRALDKRRLVRLLGTISDHGLNEVESRMLFTLGIN